MSEQFWTDPNMEPKRNHNFVVYIGGFKRWLVKSSGRPGFKIDETLHKYLNHTFKFPGGITFDNLEITLVDTVDNNATEELREILRESGYAWMDPNSTINANDLNTISKERAMKALSRRGKGGLRIDHNDHEGNIIDSWTLYGGWISAADFSNLEYGNYDLSDLKLTITYDFAKMTPVGSR